MWDSHFHGPPSKVIVEEISSENNCDKTFKVGQIYSHPLYVYKLEISKIKAYKGESYSYKNASIFVKPCFFNRENEIVKLDEYEMTTEELNADKWWIESEE
ncbi:hypothetical protein P9Z39_29275 [Bacillus thuringiensis]|uniref:hypothetical protein n=1 Tax=Bacillus thuringiensis TaxID=1428 RepID=UPI002DBD9186|nr:hypothetical protein [Bacillus thuringiensis]MEC2709703.1 hypothetical protein [Bacillus thuringiensis]